jgi:hypothetical protein
MNHLSPVIKLQIQLRLRLQIRDRVIGLEMDFLIGQFFLEQNVFHPVPQIYNRKLLIK